NSLFTIDLLHSVCSGRFASTSLRRSDAPEVAVNRNRLVLMTVLMAAWSSGCGNSSRAQRQETASQGFVGSPACRECHQAIYERWETTLMANVVQDPKSHPKAIVADFSTPNPLVTFKPADVDFTYGTKWKQRYWKKRGDDYFVLPAQWDVRHKV